MIHGIGSHSGPDASQVRNLFSRIDTNGDGKVNRDEFVAGAPDQDSDKAGQLFDALDKQKTGALSESDLLSAFKQLSAQIQQTLIQQQEDRRGPPDPSELFSKLDADGDGNVTRDEFVAGRPKGMSEDDANAFFDQLDKEGAGSLTQEQFASALEEARPKPPQSAMAGKMPTGNGGDGMNSDQIFDKLDTNKDGKVSISEWLAGRPPEISEEDATATFETMDTEGTGSLTKEQLAEGIEKNRPAAATAAMDDDLNLSGRLLAMLLEAVKSYEKSGLQSYASSTTSVAV